MITKSEAITTNYRYYQRVIINIIQSVLDNYENILLNHEISILREMLSLESQIQKLLFRLLMRQNDHILISKLKYEDIISTSDSMEILKSLNYISYNDLFSLDHSSNFSSKEESLNLNMGTGKEIKRKEKGLERIIKKENLKTIAKNLRISINGLDKQEIISKIISERMSQSTLFMEKKERNGMEGDNKRLSISLISQKNEQEIILKEIIKEDVITVNRNIYDIWLQTLSLFFLTKPSNDPLLTRLTDAILVDLDKRQYPPYCCNFEKIIFKNREEWIEYNNALNLEEMLSNNNNDEMEMTDEIYSKIIKDEKIKLLFKSNNRSFLEIIGNGIERDNNNNEIKGENSGNDSYFLKRFTPTWVYIRILDQIVTIWEGRKRFKEAVDLLELLLRQKEYCLGKRGKWWDRLVLNLDYHLNLRYLALDKCDDALNDSYLRSACRFSILKRCKKMSREKVKKQKNRIGKRGEGRNANMNDLNDEIASPRERRIIVNGKSTFSGGRLQYKLQDNFMMSVEEYALSYYKNELKWSNGIHSESSFFLVIFNLVFWDIIFDDKSQANVFLTPFQDAPLDLKTDAFYLTRKESIEHRLKELESSRDKVIQIMIDVYYAYYGCICNSLNWDLLPLSDLLSLFRSFVPSTWSSILRTLAEDFGGRRAGLPDLILWNENAIKDADDDSDQADQLLLVEVKSKNDRVSNAQHDWIRILMESGINVEICKVLTKEQAK